MTRFATVADPAAQVRIIQVGAGAMGRAWIRTILADPETELVALVDLDADAAHAALADAGATNVIVARSVSEALGRTRADAVVNVTVPVAHLAVNSEALRAGLPVLCEKPITPTVADARTLAALADETGQLLMTSQSRRYYTTITEYRDQIRALGSIGALTTEFFKAPHFGGFREEMEHVLLVDMAVHAFDAARYLLERDPISVYCHESNPTWSWYAHGANAVAVFEFAGGASYTYTGSWCAPGAETSWNGSWRASGENGSALWDGDGAPFLDATATPHASEHAPGEEIAGALADFVDAIRTGRTPDSEIHANIVSLAMVEAAVRSSVEGRRVEIAEVLHA